MAEDSKFPNMKAKYLGISYEVIGNCQMKQGRYIDAEQSFRKQLEYVQVWPGATDWSYPSALENLAGAQMRQEHWKDAASTIEKSLAAVEAQIETQAAIKTTPAEDAKLKAKTGEVHADYVKRLHRRHAEALMMLAVANAKDDRMDDAWEPLEQSYQDAVKNGAALVVAESVSLGNAIASHSANAKEIAKWAERAENTPSSTMP
jgi:tetratricopeptide (TPR) repeat protein